MTRVKTFLIGAGLIFVLEMRQRLRGVAWYVLLGVFFGILAVVTLVVLVIANGVGSEDPSNRATVGGEVFSLIIYFVLLLGTLVAPAMSGNAINGDREAGTLATTQVTLVTTGQIVIGKFLAAWVTALAFLLVSVPFLLFAGLAGGLNPVTVFVSVLMLALELGVVAGIGVGLSGLLARPLFSVVVTYLAVAALSLGTLIAFGLGGLLIHTSTTTYNWDNINNKSQTCTGLEASTNEEPRYDLVWGALVTNPYVLVADAIPSTYDRDGDPTDLFGYVKVGERQVQKQTIDQTPEQACRESLAEESGGYGSDGSPRQVVDSTTPGWPVGLSIQLILAALALWGAWMKTRTPAGRLSTGSRVA